MRGRGAAHGDSLRDTLTALRQSLQQGKPQPAKPPQFLPLAKIQRLPEVFQHRTPLPHVSAAHVRTLATAIERQGELSPVTVWWNGKAWVCIDGHHRLDAYRKAGKVDAIPVEAFEGSLEDAITRAAEANTRDSLTMAPGEKLGAAWRLTLTTKLSKAATVKASGASDGSVALMRRVVAQLLGAGEHKRAELMGMTWDQARRLAAGAEPSEPWDEAREERMVQAFATKLHKVFGVRGAKQPQIFLRAIELFSPHLYDAMREELLDTDNPF